MMLWSSQYGLKPYFCRKFKICILHCHTTGNQLLPALPALLLPLLAAPSEAAGIELSVPNLGVAMQTAIDTKNTM